MSPAATARLARLVSIVLHPFVVIAALALIAAWRLDPASLPRTVIGIGVAIASVWAFVLQRRRAGHWQTVDASRRQERPLLYVLVLGLAGGYWWWMGGIGSATSTGVVLMFLMLGVAGIANRWIKLSLHMASLAFTGVALLSLLPASGVVALALLPGLGWSRLHMARHTRAEVLGGAVLGMASGSVLLLSN